VFKKEMLVALIVLLWGNYLIAQTAMVNVQCRNLSSLNGGWQVILDPLRAGDWKQVWMEKKNATEDMEVMIDQQMKLPIGPKNTRNKFMSIK
jgi:hypothetical protein